MKIYLDKGAYMPERAHEYDAGLDLRTPYPVTVPPRGSAKINTGVHVEIMAGLAGMLKSKSGLNVNKNITCEGVIDAGYSGSIVAKLYNHGDDEVTFERGDKITQLVIVPVYIINDATKVESVDMLYGGKTERGENGFGSSGK